ncbi:AbiH family protein [Streptococcus sp. E24BD]|uniref:AbiH family protein n=1 Tax=Streptococcus sp. E24BD TaxID=3278715 RepID=UPI00359D178E
MADTILILGNGFDLAQKRKTSYTDFLEFLDATYIFKNYANTKLTAASNDIEKLKKYARKREKLVLTEIGSFFEGKKGEKSKKFSLDRILDGETLTLSFIFRFLLAELKSFTKICGSGDKVKRKEIFNKIANDKLEYLYKRSNDKKQLNILK